MSRLSMAQSVGRKSAAHSANSGPHRRLAEGFAKCSIRKAADCAALFRPTVLIQNWHPSLSTNNKQTACFNALWLVLLTPEVFAERGVDARLPAGSAGAH